MGLTGLEREFDVLLAGTPGGTLFAGSRELASVAAKRGSAVRTTIDPKIQNAAVEALAGRFGGIAVVRPRTGEVLALVGIAQSAPQPPGSVFKIITLAGVLEAGVVKRTATFPIQQAATLEGVELENANGEYCGGSLRTSFAHSCNSVFAPLGAQLGAERLVEIAERFGFNTDLGPKGAVQSTIPPAGEIGDDLAVGSTAIGQGKVLATPLQMALVTAAIGADGMRPSPVLLRGGETTRVRATKASVAKTIQSYMRTVVTDGTGGAAAVPGVEVAGKTGTAELRTTVKEEPDAGPGGTGARAGADPGPDGHRRLVHRVRAARQAEHRRHRAARRPGRRRSDRRAGGGVVLRAAPLKVEVDFGGAAADLEHQRPVLQRVGREPEEDQRPLDRSAGRRGVRHRQDLRVQQGLRVVGERVRSRGPAGPARTRSPPCR